MSAEKQPQIINPEIPETPQEKLALLQRCLAVIANDGIVVGITPRHVAQEGMYMIKNEMASQGKRTQSAL